MNKNELNAIIEAAKNEIKAGANKSLILDGIVKSHPELNEFFVRSYIKDKIWN